MDGWMDEEGRNGNERWMCEEEEEWLKKDGWMNEIGWREKAVLLENHVIWDKRHRMVKICGAMMKK